MRFYPLLCGALLIAAPAGAVIKKAAVEGWAASAARVDVYSGDGTPKGTKDLSQRRVDGLRDWNTELGLVRISDTEDFWVLSQSLKLTFCNATVLAHAMPIASNTGTRGNTNYGSGGKCPQQ